MTTDTDELRRWDEVIREKVSYYGLNCYPQEFDICDHYDMLGYMAYSGMPAHYPHWSYGKSYERQKTMYDYGISGLPYEMVINSNPCLAYLMRDNTLLLQILTIAHVYGHNDFFANNFTFTSSLDAKYTLDTFKNRANRIRAYIDDPSIGIDAVEATLDHAHSLQFQRSRNLAIKTVSYDEQRRKLLEQASPPHDPYRSIHPKKIFTEPNLNKTPPKPEENLLLFIANYNSLLPEWKQDILRSVDEQAQYFIPQIETKIMNEGWASYWHHKILSSLNLPQGLFLEFMVRHHQVLRPHPGGINPYHLGFQIWHDIERRWNNGDTNIQFGEKPQLYDESTDERLSPGRNKIFQVRESDRDLSFLRRFLTVDLMRELNLFQHEKRGKDRVVTKIADEENWEDIKENLINNTGMNSFPIIKIDDADFGKKRTLYLIHEFDGRELLLEYAEQSLRHISALWERSVVLETKLNGKKNLLTLVDDKLKIEKV
jgi:stage V sporulation protein R